MSAVQEKEQQGQLLRGGEWLVKDTDPQSVFIPEEFNEEQRNIAQMIEDFLQSEVYPKLDDLDSMQYPDLMPSLLKKAGEQGLLGISVPEEYGGFGLDFQTSLMATEVNGKSHSFTVAMAAHTGIGTLPILYFGNQEQKEKYLPKLATGEWLASYCLTEPGSGSDALAAKTRADLSEDGQHYILNGQKMWITNAGFADLFVVFAQVDGDKFTAFIVETAWDGISTNQEEKKMGIKGSSTRQVFFSDVKVPVENVLGEIGRGHIIAFNILNIGRLKLGAATAGAAKGVIDSAVGYANERKQFGEPIASFGAIKTKIGEQIIRTWMTESANFRAGDYVRQKKENLEQEGKEYSEAVLGAAREYAVECAIMKIYGSETLDFVVDEGVQIYGGYGYSAEFPMERAYRDSRINRIFEGTNEINRMLTIKDLMKKALNGELDLMTPAKNIQKELMSLPAQSENGDDSPLAQEKETLQKFKKAGLMIAGFAAQKYMQDLENHQELLLHLADILMLTYVAESGYLRAEKLYQNYGEKEADLPITIVRTFVAEAAEKINRAGRHIIHYMSEGDEQRTLLQGLKRYTKHEATDTITTRRKIADKAIAENKYPFHF